jgi:hypothetical protein
MRNRKDDIRNGGNDFNAMDTPKKVEPHTRYMAVKAMIVLIGWFIYSG